MYQAIINVMIEVHEVKEGKCSGKILSEQEMNNSGLKNNLIVSFSGATKNDCLTKLKEWLNNANRN